MIEPPCKGCPDRKLIELPDGRTTRCHSFCEKYKAYRAELDKINAEIRKESWLNGLDAESYKRKMARKHLPKHYGKEEI